MCIRDRLEGRIVSAGEVLDMISKKKVTFEDVKDVLWELTDDEMCIRDRSCSLTKLLYPSTFGKNKAV